MARFRQLLVTSALSLCTGLPASAENSFVHLGEIVLSATRTATERLRSGVSVSVLTEEELEQAGDIELADALTRLAGVSVTRSGPFGTTTALRVRGADGRYLAVYVDGIRVSDPSLTTVSFDWAAMMAADVSRVEVLRGSQSALWGGSAVGGVINITTRQATEEGFHQSIDAEAGSYGTVRLSYGLTFKDDRSEIAFTASRLHTDGFSAFDGGTERDGADATRLSFSARYQVSDSLTLGGAAYWQDTTSDYDGFLGFSLGDIVGNVEARKEAGARVFAEVSAGSTDHLFEVSASDISRRMDERGAVSTFDGNRISLGWQATTTVADAVQLVYGLDWMREEAEYSNLPGGVADTTVAGAWGQILWAPSDDLDVSATIRLDDHSAFGKFTTGRLALAWRPREGTTVRATWATGFRSPAMDELYGDYSDPSYPFRGNPALTPEESESYELGIEQSFANGSSLSLTAFRLNIDNLVQYQGCSPNDPANGDFSCQPGTFSTLVNLPGESRRQGVEIEGSLPLSDLVRLGLAYTYTDGRAPNGTRLIRIPYHQLALTLDTQLNDRLSAGASLLHVAGRRDNDANTGSPGDMPDYTLLGARVSYDLNDTTSIYLKLENLTDKKYQEVSGYAAPGRSAYLGVQMKF